MLFSNKDADYVLLVPQKSFVKSDIFYVERKDVLANTEIIKQTLKFLMASFARPQYRTIAPKTKRLGWFDYAA